MAKVEAVKLGADSFARQAGAAGSTETVSHVQELAGDAFRNGMLISDLESEHVPGSNQQFAGDGDDGLVAAQAGLEAGKLGFPVGMGVSSGLSGFDQGEA